MLRQTDATPFAWLVSDVGRFALTAIIDDATGSVVGACFTKNECYDGYAECMKQVLRQYGMPMALYTDRHTIFVSPNEARTIDQEVDGIESRLSNLGMLWLSSGWNTLKPCLRRRRGASSASGRPFACQASSACWACVISMKPIH